MSPLVAAVLLPLLVGGALVVARTRVGGRPAAVAGVVTTAVSAVLVLTSWAARSADARAGEVDVPWIDALGARWHLGMDGISLPFVLMTLLLGLLCCLSLVDHCPDGDGPPGVLVGLVLLVVGAALGVFTALDLLLFFVFFELALIPMWFVVARWGDEAAGRQAAATRFLVFTVTGSALMLTGFISVARLAGSLQLTDLSVLRVLVTGPVGAFAALTILLGLAVKTPVWPLHTWLPDAHAAAPTVGSVLLAGVFLKLGTYGLLRVWLAVAPEPAARLAPWLAAFGVVGILWSSLACLRQHDLKRLIAFSSVGHMGFVVLGLSTMSEVGVAAAVLGSVAHGVVTGLLFFLAGALKRRYGSTSWDAIGRGLYLRTPWTAGVLAFAAIASLGLPGLAVFWGELLALRAAYEVGPVLGRPLAWTLLGLAALGVVLTSAYVVAMLRRVLQGVPTPDDRDADLQGSDVPVVGVLVVATVALGLAPGLVLGVVEPDLLAVLGGVR
ncbi:complex I subunit 4 family protein [Solicola sp. PLA-1-18]|uniref:complex I subunit 4 family protein n=1 Tax=Solicola sp. PLA-1-18 TaxID=3380532 RepID=UPI003B7CEA51